MKRYICLLLAVFFILISSFPCAICETTHKGFSFSADFHMDKDSFHGENKTLLKGIADLLNILELEGTVSLAEGSDLFCLDFRIIPNKNEAASVPFRISGKPARFYISSPAFGQTVLVIKSNALLEFTVKAHEHIGLPLQHITLLFPYVHKNAFHRIRWSWNKVFSANKDDDSIDSDRIAWLINDWTGLLDKSRDLRFWTEAMGLDNGLDDILQSEIDDLPAYISEITNGKQIDIHSDKNARIWSCDEKNLFTKNTDGNKTHSLLSLSATPLGHIPVFESFYETDNNKMSFQITGGIRNNENNTYAILCELSATGLPTVWPTDSNGEITVSLSGENFYNIGLQMHFDAQSSGDYHMVFSYPSDHSELLEIKGAVTERAGLPAPVLHNDNDFPSLINPCSINETLLSQTMESILNPFIKYALPFLAEVPVSSCQSLMDYLTDSGLLDTILN